MKDGETLEWAVLDWQRKVGWEVMQMLCQEVLQCWEQIPRCCGHKLDHHSRQTRTVKTLTGDVRVRRRYYRCVYCGQSRHPADAWLGWPGGFRHGLQEVASWECSLLPYRQALENLSKLSGLEVSLEAAQRLARRWGQEELPLTPNGARIDRELVIETDGAKAHLEEGWKEIKVGACLSWDRTDPAVEPEAVSYCADWESA